MSREPGEGERTVGNHIGIGARAAGGLALVVALLASLALASPAYGQNPLAFERCPAPQERDWECATHTVPLDRSGEVPGTIDLAVRRYRPPGTPDPSDRTPFFALAGGPGESAISALPAFEVGFGAAAHRYQLIVFDQRGTGRSGALSCPALADQEDVTDPAQEDANARQAARCAEQIGPRRAFYTTLDSVADIDSLREALSAQAIGIGGVSYGTYVSAVYAQQHPNRTDRLVLDSVVPAGGNQPFPLERFGAVPRVVTDQCDDDACEGVTPTPLGDLARIAGELRSGRISGILHDSRGRPSPEALGNEGELFGLMLAGDLNPALRAGQPAAFRAAARGDAAPLLRFRAISQALGSAGAQEEVPALSLALLATTSCTDIPFPWPASMPPGEERNRLYRNAVEAVPRGAIRPFGRPALRRESLAGQCRFWPLTDSAPPPDHPPFPDVPTFIVNGTADLRTPISSAIEAQRDFAPQGELVLVEGWGHSVLPNIACARDGLERFFADQPIGDPCGGIDVAQPVQPLAPRRVRQVHRAPRTRGPRGRTLGAVLRTIDDMKWLADVHRGRFRIGGLRNGWVALQLDRDRFALRQLAYVPGVRVSGNLRIRGDDRLVGKLRVRGGRAVNGTVRFWPDGRVVGWLRGQRVQTRDTTR